MPNGDKEQKINFTKSLLNKSTLADIYKMEFQKGLDVIPMSPQIGRAHV